MLIERWYSRLLGGAVAIALSLLLLACGSSEAGEIVAGLRATATGASSATATPASTALAPPDPPVPAPSAAAPATPAGRDPSTISWRGREWQVWGVNLPWVNWECDFGCGTAKGVRNREVTGALHAAFADLESRGVHFVRWWLFSGTPHQIKRTENGTPASIEAGVFADLYAALELAREYDLYFTFVLFSAPSHLPESWIVDPEQRAALVDVLSTLFERYGEEERIFSWELFNEPEWDIWQQLVPEEPMVDLASALAEAVHEHSVALVTIGNAMVEGMRVWRDVDVDYFSPHWYDWMDTRPNDPYGGDSCAICKTAIHTRRVAFVREDVPIVIGEFFAGERVEPLARWRTWESLGYAGAWAWSLLPERTQDQMAVDMDALGEFMRERQGQTAGR